ncbi:unnamed protein product [Pieris brassicae]|uniref:Uncharacterized protein n=1 Tax=Pieris brassicae TaxID=7116 RepID=A0A9P0T957_PIEBR|nr:unnamed protein product [Pieris brassicae]
MHNTPNFPVPPVSPSSSIPSYSRSYKKTIFAKPTSPKPKRLGYNKTEHFNLIKDYDAPATSNGVALINSNLNNNETMFSISDVLIETADESFCTKTKFRSQIPSPPWWDHECTAAIKARKQAEKNYCEDMSEENFELYLESARSAKKLFKKKKYDGWQSFCASISPDVSP